MPFISRDKSGEDENYRRSVSERMQLSVHPQGEAPTETRSLSRESAPKADAYFRQPPEEGAAATHPHMRVRLW